MIKEIKRLIIDVVKAITLLCFNTVPDASLLGMAEIINIPIKGINNKDISNIKNNSNNNEHSSN